MRKSFLLPLLLILALVVSACGAAATPEPTAAPPPAAEEPMAEMQDIVDTAIAAGQFDTLVAAVQAAGLEETLRGDGPFTVFAPTDEAFAALPEDTLEALLNDVPALTEILLYHVVAGKVMAADVVGLSSAETVQGQSVAISVEGDTVKINDATVIATDIEASNGVIHVIDAVILPPAEDAMGEDEMGMAKDIVDTAIEAGQFNTLVAAVQAAGLEDALRGAGPFTLFAPTDEAFAALPEGTVEALLNDIPTLTDILLYHVAPGKVMAADVVGLDSARTSQGQSIAITVEGDTVKVNDATVIATDIEASNGVIHVIDAVLLPPVEDEVGETGMGKDILDTAADAGQFNTLLAAIEAAGLERAFRGQGPFTVFAPTDEAFAALPEGTVEALLNDIPTLTDILLYHVVRGEVMAADVVGLDSADTAQGQSVNITVEGDTVKVNDATVVATDIKASNGVIHVIDAVLLPPAEDAMDDEMGMAKDIVDTAIEAGQFNTLVAALQAAGLVDTLKGEGPFTVFAPTDEAFAALPEGTVEALLNDIPTLTDILLYHVVAGKVMAADVVGLSSAETAQGQSITITVEGDTVKINGATVITTDIETSNGVIHVIDAVLLPPSQ